MLSRCVQGFRGALGRHPSERKSPYPDAGSFGALEGDFVNHELKMSYGRSRVALLPVHPFRVHAYWEVTAQDGAAARQQLDPEQLREVKWVLRFYDVTTADRVEPGAPASFEVEVSLNARNWYVDLWSANRGYVVELGLQVEDRFCAICRSNRVRLPRAETPPSEPPRWGAQQHGRSVPAPQPVAAADEVASAGSSGHGAVQPAQTEPAGVSVAPPAPAGLAADLPAPASPGTAVAPKASTLSRANPSESGSVPVRTDALTPSLACAWGPEAFWASAASSGATTGESTRPPASQRHDSDLLGAASSRSASLVGAKSSPGKQWQRTSGKDADDEGAPG